jgi:hypothetical protein
MSNEKLKLEEKIAAIRLELWEAQQQLEALTVLEESEKNEHRHEA